MTGVATTRDNIAVTPGGQAGLFAAHMAVCDPGDAALLVDPYYATYPGTIRSGQRPADPGRRTPGGRVPAPGPGDIAALADGARSLLINTPNKPHGRGVFPLDTGGDRRGGVRPGHVAVVRRGV